MNLSKIEEINFNKQSKQQALDTFTFDYNNSLDRPIDKLIEVNQEKILKISDRYQYYQKVQIENSKDHRRLNKRFQDSGGLDMVMMDQVLDMIYLQEEIKAISETKIIYGYKHFEISLSKLIRISFGRETLIKTFRWDEVKSYFKSKDIIVSELKGYNNLNQLRLVNNMIKHSDYDLDSKIKSIPEFKKSTDIGHKELLAFYNRVKESPEIFLSALVGKIMDYLYNFDEKRVDKIAEDLALRMDKETAENLIASLKIKY